MINSIGIKSKPDKEAAKIALKIGQYLVKKGLNVLIDCETGEFIKEERFKVTPLNKMNADLIIIVGGDGTILYTVRELPRPCPPILGINLGHVGFLAEFNANEVPDKLRNIIDGKFNLKNASLLSANMNGEKFPDALNEVFIASEPGKMTDISVYVNNAYVARVLSDGLIISTSTGSTAYALSAGGPIVTPDLDVILLVPVCPFKHTMLPMVISGNSRIILKLNKPNRRALVVIDGQYQRIINYGDILEVKKSDDRIPFIKIKDNFYDKVREKLLGGI